MSREAMEAVQDHTTIDDATGRNIFVAIARFIPADGGEGWASYRTIADVAGCDKDTVGRWVELIESAGELSTRKTGKGRGTKIYYSITLPFDQPKHGAVVGDNSKITSRTDGDNNNGDNKDELSQQVQLLSQQIELLSQQVQLLSQRMSQNVPTMTGTETNKPLETKEETIETKEDTATPSPEEKPHTKLMRLYQDALGYKIPNGGKEAAAAKRILKQFKPEDAVGCYQYMKTDYFWQGKHLSLQSVFEQIGPWIGAGRPESKNEIPKKQNNGSRQTASDSYAQVFGG